MPQKLFNLIISLNYIPLAVNVSKKGNFLSPMAFRIRFPRKLIFGKSKFFSNGQKPNLLVIGIGAPKVNFAQVLELVGSGETWL